MAVSFALLEQTAARAVLRFGEEVRISAAPANLTVFLGHFRGLGIGPLGRFLAPWESPLF
jgi:hypothetical protein